MATTIIPRISPAAWTLDPERVRTAGRTAVACVISLCIVLIYRFPDGHWALITCLVMTQASVGGSLDKGLLRIVGTVVACLLAVVVLAPLNQNPLPFLAITFGIIAVAAYFGSGTFYPYTFVIGGVTLVMVSLMGFEGQNVAASAGLARSGEILVGVVVSWLTAFALWPTLASVQADDRVRDALDRLSSSFETASDFVLGGRRPPAAFREGLEAVAPGIRALLGLIPAAAREGRVARRRAPGLKRLAIHLERLRATLLPLAEPEGPVPNGLVQEMRPELRTLLEATTRLLATVRVRDPSSFEDAVLDLRLARRVVERRLDGIRFSGALTRFTASESLGTHGLLATLRETENAVNAIGRTLFEEEDLDPSPTPWTDWRSWMEVDGPRLRYAIKTGLAVCFTVVLLNLLQWQGTVSAMVTVFIVSQLSIGGTVRKALLRMAGALLGSVVALLVILFVTPHIVSLHAFAVVVFVVMFFCAYAYTGPEKSSYAGLQTGLAFVIVLVAGPKQELSIMPGVYRVVGVVLGTGISIVVESVLWRSHAYIELRDRIRQSLVECGRLYAGLVTGLQGVPPDRAEWLRQARAARLRLSDCSQILGEALLEGRQARAAIAHDVPVASATEELLHRINRLTLRFDHPVAPRLRAAVGRPFDDLLDALGATLDRLPGYLDGTLPREQAVADADALGRAKHRVVDEYESARQGHRFDDHDETEVSFFVGLLDAILRISQGVVVLCGVLSRREDA